MQTLIAGGGKIGSRLAVFLSKRGDSVVVVDEDKAHCEWVSKNSDAVVYNGSVLDPLLLMEAGINKADQLITALDDDKITGKLIDIAKSRFGVQRVIALVKNSEAIDAIRERGADKVVCYEDLILNEVENLLQMRGHRIVYFDRQQDCKIEILTVSSSSKSLGKKVIEAQGKYGRIFALQRRGELVFPESDTILEMGDDLFVIGNEQQVEKLETALGES